MSVVAVGSGSSMTVVVDESLSKALGNALVTLSKSIREDHKECDVDDLATRSLLVERLDEAGDLQRQLARRGSDRAHLTGRRELLHEAALGAALQLYDELGDCLEPAERSASGAWDSVQAGNLTATSERLFACVGMVIATARKPVNSSP